MCTDLCTDESSSGVAILPFVNVPQGGIGLSTQIMQVPGRGRFTSPHPPGPASRRLFEPLVLRQTAGGDGRRGENGLGAGVSGALAAKCGSGAFMHNVSLQPDSAIPPCGIAARPWHRPKANLCAVLVGLRRSFARCRHGRTSCCSRQVPGPQARRSPASRRAESGFPLTLCRFRAGADSRRLTPPAPLSLTRRYDRRDGMRGENGLGASGSGAVEAKCGSNAFMHNVSFQPDSAIALCAIAAWPWHRLGTNLRSVLVRLRRSSANPTTPVATPRPDERKRLDRPRRPLHSPSRGPVNPPILRLA